MPSLLPHDPGPDHDHVRLALRGGDLGVLLGGGPEEAQEELRGRLGPGLLVGAVLEESKAGSDEGAGKGYAWGLRDGVGQFLLQISKSFHQLAVLSSGLALSPWWINGGSPVLSRCSV